MVDLTVWPCGASDVLRGGVNSLPLALMVHGCGSFSSKSIGVMRTILPSLTYTNSGPPFAMFT